MCRNLGFQGVTRGYQETDDNWKTPKTVVRNLVTCARDGGNYLLNIGPKADGSIPEESVRILNAVGAWMDRNSQTIYGAARCKAGKFLILELQQKGKHPLHPCPCWPGETVSIGGLQTKVKAASGKPVNFTQDDFGVQFTGLPATAPDNPVTMIAAECESEPMQDMENIRKNRPRRQVRI